MNKSPRNARLVLAGMIIAATAALAPCGVSAQVEAEDPETVAVDGGLPFFATLGFGFGARRDDCALCESPEDDESFSALLTLGRPLAAGIGVGVQMSVWQRGRPGIPGPPDSTGAPTSTALSNRLGNASILFSYDWWHFYVQAGGGIAFGSQALAEQEGDEDPIAATWSGMGVGYTLGAGATVPVHSLVSLAFYANLNTGRYDMSRAAGGVLRDAEHKILVVGVGLSVR